MWLGMRNTSVSWLKTGISERVEGPVAAVRFSWVAWSLVIAISGYSTLVLPFTCMVIPRTPQPVGLS